jgi:hypothetical protein
MFIEIALIVELVLSRPQWNPNGPNWNPNFPNNGGWNGPGGWNPNLPNGGGWNGNCGGGNYANLCVVDYNRFFRQSYYSFATGGENVPGFPIFGQSFESCYFACAQREYECFAIQYQFNYQNPGASQCILRGFGVNWVFDQGACGQNGELCLSFQRKNVQPPPVNTGIVDINVYQQQFGGAFGGTLPGYPQYGQSFESCYNACNAAGIQCFAFAFRNLDIANPSRKSVCDLKFAGTTFGQDGACVGQSGQQLCYTYSRKPLPLPPANTGIVDKNLFRQQFGQTFGNGPTLVLVVANTCSLGIQSMDRTLKLVITLVFNKELLVKPCNTNVMIQTFQMKLRLAS